MLNCQSGKSSSVFTSISCKIVIAIETAATADPFLKAWYMGVHFGFPSKQSICTGILVLEAPCRSDKSFSENTQIYFPTHTEQQIIFPYSLLYEKGSETQCLCGFPDSNVHFLFIILHIFIFYNLLFWELIWLERMKCEAKRTFQKWWQMNVALA